MTAIARRATRRLRRLPSVPSGVRRHYLMEPLTLRAPTPFASRAARALGLVPEDVTTRLQEVLSGPLTQYLLQAGALQASGHTGLVPGSFLNALVRTLRPEIVIETGVANGLSSTYLLDALAANGHGHLYSFDLPFTESDDHATPVPLIPGTSIEREQWSPVTSGKEPGWLVPEDLRDRWTLTLGDSRDTLPSALEEIGDVDFFFHDSLHTRDHMLFEFETVWPALSPGGILATDDIFLHENDALSHFSAQVARPYVVFSDKGFIRKSSQAS